MGPVPTRLTYEFGDFHVDATQRLLRSRIDGEPLPLTSKAFETLLYLVEHRGEPVDKAALMQAVWPNVFNVPLARNARYRALAERLEAQIRSTQF
jgi:DNA-binding winged helix-turn-helix (wHTH) protein